MHIAGNLLTRNSLKQASTNDRKVLGTARVITIEDLEKLREARNIADAKKVARVVARDIKKNLTGDKESLIPKIERAKGRKKVTISDETIIHYSKSNL